MLIAPKSRAFLAANLDSVGGFMMSWAPFSFVLAAIILAAPFVSIYLIKTWPAKVEPENPMAKYRRDPLDDPTELD
jgi:hypothetical protein